VAGSREGRCHTDSDSQAIAISDWGRGKVEQQRRSEVVTEHGGRAGGDGGDGDDAKGQC
jgi:hypothetical protein